MLENLKRSINGQHLLVYFCLFVFWCFLRLFSQNALDLGWGFFPLVISLPFVPFILVWLGVQFYRNVRLYKQSFHKRWYVCHCVFSAMLLVLFVLHFF
ncbi:hypothetical protein CXF83_14775 [Shewanella sp. Choline-02u-19]|nr:hypothetical protein CXF82_02505 [Shewanella sp. GutDb-MelDb]PKG72537.1 hypothetical protein CXF86_21615 [Shewanella sp. GutCb]PKH57086.1 hypothetical protein CXF84_11485 [Shewanella sp. Bg11-22]PKI27883.1 hypothetical protein CXF83_14775 [Shewanella sp. Choline-02u-19]